MHLDDMANCFGRMMLLSVTDLKYYAWFAIPNNKLCPFLNISLPYLKSEKTFTTDLSLNVHVESVFEFKEVFKNNIPGVPFQIIKSGGENLL